MKIITVNQTVQTSSHTQQNIDQGLSLQILMYIVLVYKWLCVALLRVLYHYHIVLRNVYTVDNAIVHTCIDSLNIIVLHNYVPTNVFQQ